MRGHMARQDLGCLLAHHEVALLLARLDHLHVRGVKLGAALIQQRRRHRVDGVAVQHGARATQLICLRLDHH